MIIDKLHKYLITKLIEVSYDSMDRCGLDKQEMIEQFQIIQRRIFTETNIDISEMFDETVNIILAENGEAQ